MGTESGAGGTAASSSAGNASSSRTAANDPQSTTSDAPLDLTTPSHYDPREANMGTDSVAGGAAAASSSSSSAAARASPSTTANNPRPTTSDALLDLTPSQTPQPLATTTTFVSSSMQPAAQTAATSTKAAALRADSAGGAREENSAGGGGTAAPGGDERHVDFIGSSRTVKDLFALPYCGAGASCGVALHNVGGGTLLLDRAAGLGGGEASPSAAPPPPPPLPRRTPSMQLGPDVESSQALPSSPSSAPSGGCGDSGEGEERDGRHDGVQPPSLALSAVSSVLRSLSPDGSGNGAGAPSWTAAPTVPPPTGTGIRGADGGARQPSTAWVFSDGTTSAAGATGSTAEPVEDEPPTRQYLSWQFHEMRLLVASDALIYRPAASSAATSTSTRGDDSSGGPGSVSAAEGDPSSLAAPPPSSVMSQALTVRVEDVTDLRRKLAHHERMVRDRRAAVESASSDRGGGGGLSYAEAVASSSPPDSPRQREHAQSEADHNGQGASSDPRRVKEQHQRQEHPEWSLSASAGSFGLRQMQLQTCVLPSETAAAAPPGGSASSGGYYPPPSSPIYTCLDAYLDNIMANVPQLALCLQERGFVRSVRLLRTEEIPSSMIHASTLSSVDDRGGGGPGGGGDAATQTTPTTEPVFSPAVVDLNATMLLRFLKENCTSENSTYLLHREPGQPNIHLYDVTSISSHRQRKWTRWLAMMSYRFATKLAQHSSAVEMYHPSSRRNFRDRQRSLLRTSLDLLEELADMDGGTAHETICAAVNEQLADTYLSGGGDGVGDSGGGGGRERRSSEPKSSASAPPPPPATATGSVETGPQLAKETDTTPTSASSQPYDNIAVDALNKAQDFLLRAIRTLWPLLERAQGGATHSGASDEKKSEESVTSRSEAQSSPSASNRSSASFTLAPSKPRPNMGGGDVAVADGAAMEVEALCTQLLGLHHKLVNVSLRLAQHHFKTYWSSSAMQALRMSARRLADYVSLLETLGYTNLAEMKEGGYPQSQRQVASVIESVQYQYAWLWEYCGHFARSFAADALWRERGHACGDDVIGLLRDVETACDGWDENSSMSDLVGRCELSRKTLGEVTLHSLKVLFSEKQIDRFAACDGATRSTAKASPSDSRSRGSRDAEGVVGTEPAMKLLEKQSQLKRDERRVLVAATLCYSRSIGTLSFLATKAAENSRDGPEGAHSPPMQKKDRAAARESPVESLAKNHEHPGEFLGASNLLLLQKRYGDACNEIGKILLSLVRDILSSSDKENKSSCGPLLRSAEFWFFEGLEHFVQCNDIRNIALLRCNLCQCCKIKANHHVTAIGGADPSTNAEACLQEAADQLQLAHGALGQRDEDPRTWDMVSEELAATFLVLGVRRRQSLLGGGTMPVVAQALRLSPGKERSVVHPMEQALGIYEKLGNAHQAAAAHYQLALFFAKVWTCQRDEAKTREKLAAAFQHYHSAHRYFSSSMIGKEPTFVILSLDLSNLYSTVSGYECLTKALACCLDTCDAFSGEAVASANARNNNNSNQENEWFVKMATLSKSIEDRVFKLLLSLVKLEKECDGAKHLSPDQARRSDKYRDMYRVALSIKMELAGMEKDASAARDQYSEMPLPVYTLLLRLKEKGFPEATSSKAMGLAQDN